MSEKRFCDERVPYHPLVARRIHAEFFARQNGLSFEDGWNYIRICVLLGHHGFWDEDPRFIWSRAMAARPKPGGLREKLLALRDAGKLF